MKKLYNLTAEHRAQLKPWADKWIANAMSTVAMDDGEREITRHAIVGLYAAAKLPPPKQIVFLASPRAAVLAGSYAAGICKPAGPLPLRLLAIRHEVQQETQLATQLMVKTGTQLAVWQALCASPSNAAEQATATVTGRAVRKAMQQATSFDPTEKAVSLAVQHEVQLDDLTLWRTLTADRPGYTRALADQFEKLMRDSMGNWNINYNGGNQYSAWCSYLSFFRHVVGLQLKEYEHWQHYESAALHSGPRYMHPEFCIVSDRPEILRVDESNRSHSADGPSHRWRDGWSLYYWHGVEVTQQIIEHPETLKVEQVNAEINAEVRRIMIERMGTERYLHETGAKVVDFDAHAHNGVRALHSFGASCWLECYCPSTGRIYFMEVPPTVKTAEAADQYLRGPSLQDSKCVART